MNQSKTFQINKSRDILFRLYFSLSLQIYEDPTFKKIFDLCLREQSISQG